MHSSRPPRQQQAASQRTREEGEEQLRRGVNVVLNMFSALVASLFRSLKARSEHSDARPAGARLDLPNARLRKAEREQEAASVQCRRALALHQRLNILFVLVASLIRPWVTPEKGHRGDSRRGRPYPEVESEVLPRGGSTHRSQREGPGGRGKPQSHATSPTGRVKQEDSENHCAMSTSR